MKQLKNNKSPGPDNILNEMLKHGQSELIPVLTKLFNLVYSSMKFPNIWKSSYIVTVHKSGNKMDPGNYRGITLNSCVAKVLSSILNKRIHTYFNSRPNGEGLTKF